MTTVPVTLVVDTDEEALLKQALDMSMEQDADSPPEVPNVSAMTEEEQIAYAMQMSLGASAAGGCLMGCGSIMGQCFQIRPRDPPWTSFYFCPSSLSCMNEYLAIDICGYLCTKSSHINCCMAGCFPEMMFDRTGLPGSRV